MSFTEQDLDNLSLLARITIDPSEKEKMLHDMQAILGYISEINEVSGDIAQEKDPVRNVMREDIITHDTGSNTDALLNNAPATRDGYVEVTQVLK